MPRMKSERKLRKHTLMLFDGDFERLQRYHPELGAAIVVRQLVANFLRQLDDKHERPLALNFGREIEL